MNVSSWVTLLIFSVLKISFMIITQRSASPLLAQGSRLAVNAGRETQRIDKIRNNERNKNKLGLSCAKLSKLKLDTHQLTERVLIMSWLFSTTASLVH